MRVLEVTSLSVVLHRSASVSAMRLANKSLRVPRKKVRDELRARGFRANFAHLITRNYLYMSVCDSATSNFYLGVTLRRPRCGGPAPLQ